MNQKTGVILALFFLVLGGALVMMRRPKSESEPNLTAVSASATPSAQPVLAENRVKLPVLFSTEKEEWIREAVAGFSKLHPEIDVQLEGKGSLDSVRALLAGERKPVLWSPADSLAVNLLSTQWQMQKSVDPVVHDGTTWPRSLLLTPLTFVAWDSRAKVLLGKESELRWKHLEEAVASKKGWAGLGGDPAWAFVKLGHTDPSKSNSGLQALVLMAYGFYDRQAGLTVADVTAQPFQDFVKAIEAGRQGQDFGAASTGTFMQNLVRQGPSLYDVAIVYESLAISEIPRAQGRWESLRVLYPNINLWSDHPLCLLEGDWVTPAQKKAAVLLADYLMSPAVQRAALKRGFRPGNLDVPVITTDTDNPFNKYKDLGVRVDVPRIAKAPEGAVLQALLQVYQRNLGN
ncbi:MAG: substrate-binding domain-containing protein [Polyangiales bacterium]